jgi:thiol-disulfide isomerase/thioredoxin
MKTFFTGLLPLLALLSPLPSLHAANLGDPAGALEISDWAKGDAVDLESARGKKVVVIEFWATWCGPCRVSIPHLTELQKKYESRGVTIVGVSDETSATVKSFVSSMGEKMDYTVAVDRDRRTSEAFMGAYSINGIPHAFVVDKEGRIAWHGHPMYGLERVLEQLASNTFDMAAERRREGAQRKIMEYYEMAMRGDSDDKLDKLGAQLTALDKEMGGIEPSKALDLPELRKMGRFQGLMREYQQAMFTGKSEAELEKIEKKAAPLAPKEFNFAEFKSQFQLQRVFTEYYRAVTGRANEGKTEELAQRLEGVQSGDAEALTEIAWTLLTDEKIKTRNPKLALKIARAAFDASEGKDANAADTYARALFDTGKVAEAILQQKKAIELCDDKDKKSELQATLKRYQEKSQSQ